MKFYIKTNKGKPIVSGSNNDCLIYMRQYGGPKTAFEHDVFTMSTEERIKPELWDSKKNYPKSSQADTIAAINALRTKAEAILLSNRVNGIITTTALLREMLRPEVVSVVEVEPDTLLSLWNEKLRNKKKPIRPTRNKDTEVWVRDALDRWFVYKEELWLADLMNSKLSASERDQHKVAYHPADFTEEMFEDLKIFLTVNEEKAYNTVQTFAAKFKNLCRWINEKKKIRVGFGYENIDAKQSSGRKGKNFALPLEHVTKIADLNVSKVLPDIRHIEYIKDMFLLQIFVGCRISDLFRVAHNINKGNELNMEMTKRTKDKGKRVVQVLVQPALDILKKYEYNTPPLVPHVFNEGIRQILKVIDPYTKYQVRNDFTGKWENQFLWEHFSSHDCIRTCVMIADQTGMPVTSNARNVGKTEQTLLARYLSVEDKVAHADWELYEDKLMKALAPSKRTDKTSRTVTSKIRKPVSR